MAYVGIDLGGTQLRVAVADDRGRLRTVVRHPTEAARGRQIGLFAPDGARKEEAIATARYLRAKLGKGAVLRAKVTDEAARLPERANEWVEVIA